LCMFERLGATYAVYLKLSGKRVVDSGLSISDNWTFFTMCYSYGATREYRLKFGVFCTNGVNLPNISGTGVVPTNYYSCHKRRQIVFYMYKNFSSRLFRFVTIHAFDKLLLLTDRDRQTDGRTDRKSTAKPCIAFAVAR